MGIRATMYAQTRRASFEPALLNAIQDLGHEVGFHHECMDRTGGDPARARELFLREVELFRRHGIDLKTVCSHGEGGLRRSGYRSNRELFLAWPDLLDEAGIKEEVYFWRKRHDHGYASDTFSSYRRFWNTLDDARLTDRPMMILVHLHRWHRSPLGSALEVMRDLRQHAANRILGRRAYDVVS